MQSNTEDFELVKKFIEGDQSAFNKIVGKYQQKIYWVARRMTGNHLDADDVVQEVLLVLYDKLKFFEFRSSLFTWIYKIVSTRSINTINKRKVKRFFFIDDHEDYDLKSNDDFVRQLENKEKIKRIEKLLLKVPPKQREVFIYRNFEQLSYDEIAEITGKSVGALKANYFHALNKLTKFMENENE